MKVQNTMQMLKDLGELNSTIPMQDLFIGTKGFPIAIHPEFKRQLIEMSKRDYSLIIATVAVINKDAIKNMLEEYIGKENAEVYRTLVDIFRPDAVYSTEIICILKDNGLMGFQEILFLLQTALLLITPYSVIESKSTQILNEYLERSMLINTEDISQVIPIGILENISEEDKKNIIGSIWNCIIDIIDYQTSNKEVKGGE